MPDLTSPLLSDDDDQPPVSVIPPAPSSLSTPPPPSSGYPDPEAMLVALVLSPSAYPRNRFFSLFNVPSLRKARWRAAQLRGLVNALARPKEPIADYDARPHEGGKVMTYRVPALNLRVRAFLQRHEAAVVELAVARIRGEQAPPDALDTVNRWLGRLSPVPPFEGEGTPEP